MEMIRTENLTKRYGERIAVDNLSMEVKEGDIYGFVGPNGAGKTSTIRMLATLLAPDAGEIWIAGQKISNDHRSTRSVIGYMPDFFGIYNDMTVGEYLDFFAACYEIPENKWTGMIGDLLELVDLSHRRQDPLESLSRGMKQRLSLARTLVHNPRLLILDEPASGLDPRARVEMRELLLELARLGKTIFFSTHILMDVAEVCTRVGILEAGKLVAEGPLENLAQSLIPQRFIRLKYLGGPEQAKEILLKRPEIENIVSETTSRGQPGENQVRFWFTGGDEDLSNLLADLIKGNVRVIQFTEQEQDLEQIFMRATQGLVT